MAVSKKAKTPMKKASTPMKKAKTPMKKAKTPLKKASKYVKKATVKKAAGEATPCKRSSTRRDTDDQIERAIGKRLGHIPQNRWQGAIDEDGVDFWTYIGRSLKKTHAAGGNLGTRFWSDTYSRFALNDSPAADLADPPDEEIVDQHLIEVLAVANNGNPAGNPGAPFERLLEHCARFNRRSLFGMCHATCESPSMSRAVAQRCQVAILKYVARENEAEHNRDYWDVMKDQWAHSVMMLWEELAEGGLRPGLFLATYSECLSLYHDPADIQKIIDAGDDDDEIEKVAPEILKVSNESCIGESMFAEAALKARRFMYIKAINTGLRQLLDHSFLESETTAFKRQALATSQELVKCGIAKYEKVSSRMNLHSETCKVQVEDPDDEWEWRELNLAKSMVVNSGQSPMMPWEALLYDVGYSSEFPRYTQIPAKLLAKIKPAREAAVDYLGPGPHTLPQMILSMLGHKKDLKKLDRSFATDLIFLEKHSERLLKEKLVDMVMTALPSAESAFTVGKATCSIVGIFSHMSKRILTQASN